MPGLQGISFLWAAALIAVLALVYAVRAWLGYRQVAQDASDDYEYKAAQGMVDKRLSKAGYIRAYKRYYAPRAHLYTFIGLLAIIILTAPVMAVLNYVMMELWAMNGRPVMYAPSGIIWMFINFFCLLAAWIGIGYVFARQYHKHAPVSLRDELIREMD